MGKDSQMDLHRENVGLYYYLIQRSDKNEVGEFERTLVYMKFSVLNTRWLTRDDDNDDVERTKRGRERWFVQRTLVCIERDVCSGMNC